MTAPVPPHPAPDFDAELRQIIAEIAAETAARVAEVRS